MYLKSPISNTTLQNIEITENKRYILFEKYISFIKEK